ncbi:MAG: hypothetical protein MH252_05885 [Thermosynechococcaceae cyanobacterium MS004]|nr:hypothetical protein [Thermosynechococcaceae cyanobacterium MS004]
MARFSEQAVEMALWISGKTAVNSPQQIETIRDASRKQYGHPRKSVEKEITATHQTYKEGRFEPSESNADTFDLSDIDFDIDDLKIDISSLPAPG